MFINPVIVFPLPPRIAELEVPPLIALSSPAIIMLFSKVASITLLTPPITEE